MVNFTFNLPLITLYNSEVGVGLDLEIEENLNILGIDETCQLAGIEALINLIELVTTFLYSLSILAVV